MKKMVLGMVIGMMISAVVGFYGYTRITEHYESELTKCKETSSTVNHALAKEVDDLTEDYVELSETYETLEDEVYNAMNGDNYKIEIYRDGTHHIYEKTGTGLFRDKSHTTIKVSCN